MTNPDSPIARALRALQKLDEVTEYPKLAIMAREYVIEAETILGELLGLTCTGEPSGWNDAGEPVSFSHDGDTCPVHEWLVPADQREVIRLG